VLPGFAGKPWLPGLGGQLRGNPLGSRVAEGDERSELALEASGFLWILRSVSLLHPEDARRAHEKHTHALEKTLKFKYSRLHWKGFILGLAGVLLILWMIHKIGFSTVSENLVRFGAGSTLFLILLYSAAQMLYCLAWHVILVGHGSPVSLWKTFIAYSAGDALNMTIPSANLAGEPVKTLLIRHQVSFETAVSSQTIYKFSDILSMTLFLLAGWLITLRLYPLPLLWNIGAGVVGGGMALLCLLLYFLQNRGIYQPLEKWLTKINMGRWIISKLESADLIDRHIADFYRHHPSIFLQSLALNFIAWFGGVLEIVLFMRLFGIPVSFTAALTIETFSMFLSNLIFFVPGRLGVGEGGRVALFLALGYSASSGLVYGIIRRLRELAWIALGIIILAIHVKKVSPVGKPAPQQQQ
jgi:uncharacterized membrane protein YbhN (UPF0104 family)